MAQQRSGQDVTAGKGQRDEVGRSGVYPATGPYPEGDVTILTPGEINRGETGEEHDHDRDDEQSDALGG
jgi:hypothetical protein